MKSTAMVTDYLGVGVVCPSCEAKSIHDLRDPDGVCRHCQQNYHILLDGRIVDDNGLDEIMWGMCET